MSTINGLNERKKMNQLNGSFMYSNLSSMVLLLVGEMITAGTRDFHIILRMIDSFIEFQGGLSAIDVTPLGKFLVQQIKK